MRFSRFISNHIKISSLYHQRQHWRDIVIVLVLMITAGFASYQGAQLIDPVIFDTDTNNVWFGADIPRVFRDMTDRGYNHYRTKVHPLFVLLTFPPVLVLTKLGIKPITAVTLVIAVVASLWLSTLFILLRLIGCRRFDAVLFSILGATSASAIFFFVVTETYPFGSVSLLLALVIVAVAQYRKLSPLWYTLVSALTLSFTVTNWMIGILATVVNHHWKRALQITANALCLVVVLWAVQKYIFPSSEFFLGDREEKTYILLANSGGPLQCIKSFIFHTMVLPAIKVVNNPERPDWSLMITQQSPPGSGSLWGAIAVGLWGGLLALGLWGLFSVKKHLQLRIVLGLTLLGQLVMHSVYGDETFLFSLHFAPLLVVLVALSTLTRARPFALVLAGALVLSAGMNNGLQLSKAIAILNGEGPPRHEVQVQMRQRPADPWPRGTGHVVLAAPGSREVDKAYHEPGGSFSPSVGSFGVSFWLTDSKGNLETTSDTIPSSQISQQLTWANDREIPGILTETNDYQSVWSSTEPGQWTLNLKKTQANTNTTMVVIRSVGPAGGPIRSLDWNNQQLRINDRWSVTISPAPTAVHLGSEGSKGWMTERSALTQWKGENGWGYARFELGNGNDWNLVVKDSISQPISELKPKTRSALELDLPDQRFAQSLDAQVAHMMMGIVNRETRPGDPTNYPLPWLRDGAYEVVALARAGQLQVAKELSTYFAENDFFGGFGPEADAPGLSIWALSEVAVRLNQPEYDQWLWPRIRSKAEFILEMLSTKQPIHRPVTAPILRRMRNDPELTLVAEPARNGLIIGRMDNHRPLLFVNAVSYRGLLDAASLADRVNKPVDAKRWRNAAAQLKQAWEKAFKPPESENERTYISSLWPTWIAASQTDALRQNLQARWTKLRDPQGEFRNTPLWTYFDIAEAHQWLFLDQPDRAWTTLQWFWDHQASPGLYTWWEGNGEENTSRRWERVRGWVNPPHVTPHYWTAAEMLLMQLDMLAYTDEAASEPTIVIGAGIPKTWLNQPMRVRGLSTSKTQVDWIWDGKQMDVQLRGKKVNVQLGSVFPVDTPLRVKYLDLQ